MKTELNPILVTLRTQYKALEVEYINECAINFMSRRATYLDGQLAMLHQVIEMLNDINTDLEVEQALDDFDESDFDESDFDFDDEVDDEVDDDVDETNYDPYCGCEHWCD